MKLSNMALLVIWSFAGVTIGVAKESAWETSLETNIQGKGGWFTCLSFAKDLHRRLELAGTETHLVVYEWENEDRQMGRHAIVVYRDEQGRFWAMDAKASQPRWVQGTTPQEWVNVFARESQNKVLHHRTNARLLAQNKDLSGEQMVWTR